MDELLKYRDTLRLWKSLLGISDWRITVSESDAPRWHAGEAHEIDATEQECAVYVYTRGIEGSHFETADRVIAHELIHCALAELKPILPETATNGEQWDKFKEALVGLIRRSVERGMRHDCG